MATTSPLNIPAEALPATQSPALREAALTLLADARVQITLQLRKARPRDEYERWQSLLTAVECAEGVFRRENLLAAYSQQQSQS